MKRNKLYLLSTIAALLFAFTSCSDYLEVFPTDQLVTETALTDLPKARTALFGVYDRLQTRYYYGTNMISWGEVRGDDMGTTLIGDRTAAHYGFNHLTPLTYTNSGFFWEVQYIGLNRVNLLLEAIEDGTVKISPSEQTELNDIKGQALALRALFHFDLVRLHGEPYLKNKLAPGAVIAKRPILAGEFIQRSTVEQTYAAIIEDLLEAIDNNLLSADKKNGLINIWAAKALLARVFLYQGNWEQAYNYAKDVAVNGGYSLIPTASYVSSWSQVSTTESIFEVVQTETDNADRESIGYVMLPPPDGYGAMSATEGFIALMNEDPNDVRLGILKRNGQGVEGGYVAKYPGRGGNRYVNNTRVIRLSDVYLMVAEAGVYAGKADASTYLNAIRKRANPAAADVTATLDLVAKERRKELIGEGHRFFDIIRNLGTNTVTRVGTSSYPVTRDMVPVLSWNNADTYRLILPIPSDEIDVNPDIYQNAGYGGVK